jgi:hypothetical protein
MLWEQTYYIRECIQKFPNWVDNEINNNKHSLRSNTRLTHKIAIQLHLVAESCTICSSLSRRPVRKLMNTPVYTWTVTPGISFTFISVLNRKLWLQRYVLCPLYCLWTYESVSISSRTGRLERELQMVELSATGCSCIAILWVSLMSFAAVTPLCCFLTSVYCCKRIFRYDSVRILLYTSS